MKSNYLKYQDSVAKDEYCKVGQSKECSSAIYDSMQFLAMKREKSMNSNTEAENYLKMEKRNSLLKYHTKDPICKININEFGLGEQERINGKINNYFSNKAFIARSQIQPRQGNLNEDVSSQNLLCDSIDNFSKKGSPDSINSMYDQRGRMIENAIKRQ